jgi:hypothetical protein
MCCNIKVLTSGMFAKDAPGAVDACLLGEVANSKGH